MTTTYDPINCYVYQACQLLEKFRARDINIFSWVNKFESVADYIGVPDNKKVELLCIMINFPESLHYLKDQLINNSYNFSYEKILTAFCSIGIGFTPLKIARIRFLDRVQYKHETIEKYSESLLNMYTKCRYDFDDTNCLRSRFVDGLYDEHIRNYLKGFRPIPFNEAVRKAVIYQNLMNALQNRLNIRIANIQKTNETQDSK